MGHKFAQQNIASQIALNSENENPIIQSLIKKALDDAECASALMQLIELDWSITYIDSINLILRSLVDNGDQRAASFLGRILLERKDYKTRVHILNLADKLDDPTIDKIDLVLIMSVFPGFGGQKFIPEVIKKIEELNQIKKNKKLNFDIEVDGGINFSNSKIVIEAGANILVSGTTIFKENNGDIKKNINTLKLV